MTDSEILARWQPLDAASRTTGGGRMSKSFEKWWATVPAEYTDVVSEDVARSAYTAGMERAAEICKSKHENMDSKLNYVAGWLDAEAAIRKEAGG